MKNKKSSPVPPGSWMDIPSVKYSYLVPSGSWMDIPSVKYSYLVPLLRPLLLKLGLAWAGLVPLQRPQQFLSQRPMLGPQRPHQRQLRLCQAGCLASRTVQIYVQVYLRYDTYMGMHCSSKVVIPSYSFPVPSGS